eukprot:438803-Rhodomonas_salina.1
MSRMDYQTGSAYGLQECPPEGPPGQRRGACATSVPLIPSYARREIAALSAYARATPCPVTDSASVEWDRAFEATKQEHSAIVRRDLGAYVTCRDNVAGVGVGVERAGAPGVLEADLVADETSLLRRALGAYRITWRAGVGVGVERAGAPGVLEARAADAAHRDGCPRAEARRGTVADTVADNVADSVADSETWPSSVV